MTDLLPARIAVLRHMPTDDLIEMRDAYAGHLRALQRTNDYAEPEQSRAFAALRYHDCRDELIRRGINPNVRRTD